MATSSSSISELLLTSSPDGCITTYDASTGSPVSHFCGSRTPRKGLALISNKLITASHVSPDTGNGSIHLFNWWSSAPFHGLTMPEPVAPLVATADGLYLFAGGISGRIHSVFVSSRNVINSVPSHATPITCLEINADGSLIFSGGDDGTISVFSTHQLVMYPIPAKSLPPLQRFHGHEASITGITPFTRKSSCTLISCSMDCTVKFWTINQPKPLLSVSLPCTIWDLKMAPLETEFYCAGSDGCIYRGDLRGKSGLKIIPWSENHGKAWTFMALLDFGRCVVSVSDDGAVCFWDTGNGKMVKSFETGRYISHLVVRKPTAPVATVDDHGGCHRWEMEFLNKKVPSELARETMEMKGELDEAVTDRQNSIGTLEKAVGGYERLLNMILKEVRASAEVKDGAKKKTQKKK